MAQHSNLNQHFEVFSTTLFESYNKTLRGNVVCILFFSTNFHFKGAVKFFSAFLVKRAFKERVQQAIFP